LIAVIAAFMLGGLVVAIADELSDPGTTPAHVQALDAPHGARR
jgi:hypothetical protein